MEEKKQKQSNKTIIITCIVIFIIALFIVSYIIISKKSQDTITVNPTPMMEDAQDLGNRDEEEANTNLDGLNIADIELEEDTSLYSSIIDEALVLDDEE